MTFQKHVPHTQPAKLATTPSTQGTATTPSLMSEDDDHRTITESQEKRRSWLERLSAAFSGDPHTLDDLLVILRSAEHHGIIATDTLRMMEGAIAIADLTVGDVMVPRSQMVSLPVESDLQTITKQMVESGHSRFPVHGENKDEVLGILLAKDLLRGVSANHTITNVHELLRPVGMIPESKNLTSCSKNSDSPTTIWPLLSTNMAALLDSSRLKTYWNKSSVTLTTNTTKPKTKPK